jgi:hypothetical protein
MQNLNCFLHFRQQKVQTDYYRLMAISFDNVTARIYVSYLLATPYYNIIIILYYIIVAIIYLYTYVVMSQSDSYRDYRFI